ncbi:MAG: hypothetical protein JO147_12730, partial [Actinobacteria bacterium]|nr:hypothetical protein [Actinomycetota bacterium]
MPLEPTDDPAESASENSSALSARVARHSAGRSARQSAVRARRSYWPAALLGARVVVALLSIFVVLAAGYTWATFRSFTDNVTHINAIVKPTPTVTGSNGATIAPQDIDGTDENILLVGDDHRPANATKAELAQLGTTDDGGSDNTDTMM